MWTQLDRMTFDQFEAFIRLHGGKSWRWTENFDSGPVAFMDGRTQFVDYRCDNIRVWCRPRGR